MPLYDLNDPRNIPEDANASMTEEALKSDIKATSQVLSKEASATVDVVASTSPLKVSFEKSDYDDYATRFFNGDIHNSVDGPSDIAFFSIVKDEDRSKIIFPLVIENHPGIANKRYKQFIVLQANEASNERYQITENTDNFTLNFFKGKRPEILQISGVLKNTKDNPWNINMLLVWEGMIRGSILAQKGYIMQLYIDGIVYYGYPLNFQRSKAAGTDFMVNFSMNFIVIEKSPLESRYEDLSFIQMLVETSNGRN